MIVRSHGVQFELTREQVEDYREAFDLQGYNRDDSNELPLDATYVIDSKGVISHTFLWADYRSAVLSAILDTLKSLE